jgi:flavin reductase (DIM6/NTAB) family NADH-FMN oxidoreductase RutF
MCRCQWSRRVSRTILTAPLNSYQTRGLKNIAPSFFTQNPSPRTQGDIRAILRKTAQPVTVLTAILPSSDSSKPPTYHGATLSSFTSISMHPLPLVAFAIRTPSRMASSLTALATPHIPHMVVNLLSASQSSAALQFSRPDIYPEPFRDTPFHLTDEGIPILTGSLGAFSCALLASMPLDKAGLTQLGLRRKDILDAEFPLGDTNLSSQLFIARILRVENPVEVRRRTWEETAEDVEDKTLPLIYHERRYATVGSLRAAEFKPKTQRTDEVEVDIKRT